MPKTETWGAMQRRWGSIVADYTVEQTKQLIRNIIEAEEPFYTYSLLLILKYRWDCPDPVFDLLDDIWALQKQHAEQDKIEGWDRRARSVLRQLIRGEAKSAEPLRPPSSSRVH